MYRIIHCHTVVTRFASGMEGIFRIYEQSLIKLATEEIHLAFLCRARQSNNLKAY
jgi:hypothetical protein